MKRNYHAELNAELDRMEAADPQLKAIGDRLRGWEAWLRGEGPRPGQRDQERARWRDARRRERGYGKYGRTP